MNEQDVLTIGMRALQARLKEAIGDESRRKVATRAGQIACRVFGDDAPVIDETHVRDLDSRLVNPPTDGRILRCVLAAVGIPLVDALVILGFWPDANLSGPRSTAMAVAETMRILGYPDAELVSTQGRIVTIRI